jgi:sirohydrochlorin ferrochelatase
LINSTAYLLVSHGSRDPRSQLATSNLAQIISQKLSQQGDNNLGKNLTKTTPVLVDTACLELAPLPLHQTVIQFAQFALNLGLENIKIIPLFLLPGVHVCEDLPSEINLAQQDLGEKIKINLSSYLGSNSSITKLIQQEFERLNCEGKIILAHGSRRQGSNQIIEEMASNLSALASYWSVASDLENKLLQWENQGTKKVGIVPYFLFTGAITDAIAQQVEILQTKYPQLDLKFGNTLDKNPHLIELIIESL